MPTTWNKEQAELPRHIALAGGSCDAEECQGAALDALIKVGFVRPQGGDRVALTDAGLSRARELRHLTAAGLARARKLRRGSRATSGN